MMKWLIFPLSMILATLAIAEPVNFEWQAPTEYVDDTPLPAAELEEYTLICEGQTFTYPADQTMPTEEFAPGTYSCVVTVTAVNGLTSAPSNAVSFTVAQPPSRPKAPTGLTATTL